MKAIRPVSLVASFAVVLAVAMTGCSQETADEETARSSEMVVSECAHVINRWHDPTEGGYGRTHWRVRSDCRGDIMVRVDIVNAPDTNCQVMVPGQVLEFSRGIGASDRMTKGVFDGWQERGVAYCY